LPFIKDVSLLDAVGSGIVGKSLEIEEAASCIPHGETDSAPPVSLYTPIRYVFSPEQLSEAQVPSLNGFTSEFPRVTGAVLNINAFGSWAIS